MEHFVPPPAALCQSFSQRVLNFNKGVYCHHFSSYYISGVSNSNFSEGLMRTYKVTQGRIMTLTQQWQHLTCTRKSLFIVFPAKGIVNYRQIPSSGLYVRSKGTCSLSGRTLLTVKKLNNLNVNYLKVPKIHRGPHLGLPDVFCKNTGLFVNNDKNLIIAKIIELRRRPSCCSYCEHCTFKHSLSISLPLAMVTMIEVKTLSERLIFVRLTTFTMKTALYEKKFKKTLNQRILVRLILNLCYLHSRA